LRTALNKKIKKWNRVRSRISVTDETNSSTLYIEGESLIFRLKKSFAEVASMNVYMFVGTAVMVLITIPVLMDMKISKFWIIGSIPVWVYLLRIMIFMFMAAGGWAQFRSFFIEISGSGKCRVGRPYGKKKYDTKKKEIEINIDLPGNTHPYGLGNAAINGHTVPDPESIRDKAEYFFYYCDLPEKDLKKVLDFKNRHRIKGDISTPGMNKVYRNFNKGELTLVIAVENGDLKKIEKLIRCGFDIDMRPPHWDPALITAAKYGQTDAVKLLLENSADPDIRDDTGKTALEILKEELDEDEKEKFEEMEALFRAYINY
ncbi:MAG: ankyrin repeat domain-containing protein, partial [Actinomycetia bacterium]|nr:ankyrin repeat domain-containing protein [Actinomycetes bacterium]